MAEKEYHIHVCNTFVSVSEDVYKTIQSSRRKAKTIAEKDRRNGLISYDAMDTDDLVGEEMIPDQTSPSVEDAALSNVLTAELHCCLALLPEAERDLIFALYFERKSERYYAKILGISQKAVNKRRHKALAHMRKLMRG